jgi:hypothetical protein
MNTRGKEIACKYIFYFYEYGVFLSKNSYAGISIIVEDCIISSSCA